MVDGGSKHETFTVEDLRRLPEGEAWELVEGELSRKALPRGRHGGMQGELVASVLGPFQKGKGGPGGWWFAVEVDVQFASDTVLRPDIAGWRRETCAEPPDTWPMAVRPDWVCEVLSPTDRRRDLVRKLAVYHQAQVPHYWVVDPDARILTVHRWHPEGYLIVVSQDLHDAVVAEPFDAVPLDLGPAPVADPPASQDAADVPAHEE